MEATFLLRLLLSSLVPVDTPQEGTRIARSKSPAPSVLRVFIFASLVGLSWQLILILICTSPFHRFIGCLNTLFVTCPFKYLAIFLARHLSVSLVSRNSSCILTWVVSIHVLQIALFVVSLDEHRFLIFNKVLLFKLFPLCVRAPSVLRKRPAPTQGHEDVVQFGLLFTCRVTTPGLDFVSSELGACVAFAMAISLALCHLLKTLFPHNTDVCPLP